MIHPTFSGNLDTWILTHMLFLCNWVVEIKFSKMKYTIGVDKKKVLALFHPSSKFS